MSKSSKITAWLAGALLMVAVGSLGTTTQAMAMELTALQGSADFVNGYTLRREAAGSTKKTTAKTQKKAKTQAKTAKWYYVEYLDQNGHSHSFKTQAKSRAEAKSKFLRDHKRCKVISVYEA